jgi:hypothetical protein
MAIRQTAYVREDLIPEALIVEYQSLFDRADLYIPFSERSSCLWLQKAAFIRADRRMKNRYGRPPPGCSNPPSAEQPASAYCDKEGMVERQLSSGSSLGEII